MKARYFAVAALSVVLAAGAATVVLPEIGAAQQAAPAAQKPHREHHNRIEGRIAFLHAELKITPGQQPQWDKVAEVMRANSRQMEQTFQQMRGDRDKPQTAVEVIDRRARFAEMRLNAEKSFAAAFTPLYQSLTADQKQSADDLFGRFGHHRRGGGGWR